jgi:hypothetical protein
VPVLVPSAVSVPVSAPVPNPVPGPVPVPVARADYILSYINSITLSGRTLIYPSSSSAEERAVKWLIDEDLNTAVDDKMTMRQRYALI